MNDFNLLMISAGFEQGGNVLQRHFDGHPELIHYFAESQLGTSLSESVLSAIPFRYTWPVISTENEPRKIYDILYDEELKTFLRTPERSKFKDSGAVINEKERTNFFCNYLNNNKITRKNVVQAYFLSAHFAWENYNPSSADFLARIPKYYVGYCPAIVFETDKILNDFPNAKIVHIVRNPTAGYADTIKRPFPWSIEKYSKIWNMIQLTAATYKMKYPDNFYIIRYEDFLHDKEETMRTLALTLGIGLDNNILYPSFNGKRLEKIKPWGAIEEASEEYENKVIQSLDSKTARKITIETNLFYSLYGYQ